MAVVDPWMDNDILRHINDLHSRVDALEAPDDDGESFDDDQLSRLGINNVIRDFPESDHGVLTPITSDVGIIGNNAQWVIMDDIVGPASLDIQGDFNYHGVELDSLIESRINDAIMPLETRIIDLESMNDFLIGEIRRLEEISGSHDDEILRLNEIIRRLETENGQDNP